MEFTFKVVEAEGSDEFLKFIETLDFVVPLNEEKKQQKKNGAHKKKKNKSIISGNIIPAQNPNGNPLMMIGAFDHIKDVKAWRKKLWERD